MRNRLTFLVLLALLATLAPGCDTYNWVARQFRSGKKIDTSAATPPADFKFSMEARDVTSPPTDYLYEFNRSGKSTYDVTVRSPRRLQDDGEFEINEDQIIAIWRVLHDVQFESLNPIYPEPNRDGPDRTQGVQKFYAYGGGEEFTVVSRFQAVAALDKIRVVVLAAVPDDIEKALGSRGRAPPKEYIADLTTHVFHVPDCARLKDVPAQQRQVYENPWDALNFGNQPCAECRPMPQAPSTSNK